MVFTTFGRDRVALLIGSDVSNQFISYFGVGSGSGVELNSNVVLVNEFARFGLLGSPDFTTSRKVTFTGDISSASASGLILKEFGLFTSGPALVGSTWARETIANGGSVVFDGTVEGRIQYTIEVL